MSPASESDLALGLLGQDPTVAQYLDKYLGLLEPEEARQFTSMAETALFDKNFHAQACVQYGRLDMVRKLRRKLEPYITQHTR